RSKREQVVTIARAELTVRFREGETIWTESSHKYSRFDVVKLAETSGFCCDSQWVDTEWPFAENLLIAKCESFGKTRQCDIMGSGSIPSGSSSAVERQLPKLDVVGSIPISRSMIQHLSDF